MTETPEALSARDAAMHEQLQVVRDRHVYGSDTLDDALVNAYRLGRISGPTEGIEALSRASGESA